MEPQDKIKAVAEEISSKVIGLQQFFYRCDVSLPGEKASIIGGVKQVTRIGNRQWILEFREARFPTTSVVVLLSVQDLQHDTVPQLLGFSETTETFLGKLNLSSDELHEINDFIAKTLLEIRNELEETYRRELVMFSQPVQSIAREIFNRPVPVLCQVDPLMYALRRQMTLLLETEKLRGELEAVRGEFWAVRQQRVILERHNQNLLDACAVHGKAIKSAIEGLRNTKSFFKSKTVEQIRQNLEDALEGAEKNIRLSTF